MNVACLLHVSQSICKQNTIEVGTGQNRNLHYLLKCHIKSSACSQLVRIYCVLASGYVLVHIPILSAYFSIYQASIHLNAILNLRAYIFAHKFMMAQYVFITFEYLFKHSVHSVHSQNLNE